MKQKLLDRSGSSKNKRAKGNYGKGKIKQIPLDELPMREKIRTNAYKNNFWFGENRQVLSYKVIENFLLSKVDHLWDDVYSELLTKIRDNKKWCLLNDYLSWLIELKPYYDGIYPFRSRIWKYRLLYDKLYVDIFGYIRYYKTEEELIYNTKKILRERKLKRLLMY